MGLFNKNSNNTVISERQLLVNKFNSARSNILLIVVLTLINIILLVTNTNTYFLFSAYIPFFLVDMGMFLCGLYPSEFYEGNFLEIQSFPIEIFIISVVLSAIILVLYVISWVFSKKPRVGWLIFALVFFSLDTIAMLLLNGFVMESIIDYVIHGLVIFSFVKGILVYRDIKRLPNEESDAQNEECSDEYIDNTNDGEISDNIDDVSSVDTSEQNDEVDE